MTKSVAHQTVVIKKTMKAPVAAVYSAFASVKARSEWAVPQGEAIKYIRANFKVGGADEFRCGSPAKLEFKGVVQYHELQKNKRIISTETMSHSKKIISVALLTTDLIDQGGVTEVVITAQVCSLDGNDMSAGYKNGWTAVLKNLAKFLA